MGRPGLPLGTAGTVRVYATQTGFNAITRYRDWDGKVRQVKRYGATMGAARRSLATAIRDRSLGAGEQEITGETRVSAVAKTWFDQLQARDLSPSTVDAYRDRLDKQILPALGGLRVRELSVGVVERHLATVRAKHGPSLAKTTRSVLSGVCGLACRHDALPSNPCRDVSRISTRPKRPTALTVKQLQDLHECLGKDARSVERDLPDLVLFLIATGLRIGEALAVRWCDIDLDEATVSIHGTVLRIRGVGLIIKPSPKSTAGERILELPGWAVQMLRVRRTSLEDQEPDLCQVFPAVRSGGLRDPSNTLKMLRRALAMTEFAGVTSRYFRKSVATLMDDAGLSARAAADQLGHAKPSLTADLYIGRRKRATGAAEVLEGVFPSESSEGLSPP